jgi:hypothetical protein
MRVRLAFAHAGRASGEALLAIACPVSRGADASVRQMINLALGRGAIAVRCLYEGSDARGLQAVSCRCEIIPMVAGGLQVMSGNRAFLKTFPQFNSIIPESCRLFFKAREIVGTGGFAAKPCYSTSDYSFSAFPQVRRAVGRYRQLPQVRGGTAAVPPPVLRWYCGFRPFPGTGNNEKPRSRPGLVL